MKMRSTRNLLQPHCDTLLPFMLLSSPLNHVLSSGIARTRQLCPRTTSGIGEFWRKRPIAPNLDAEALKQQFKQSYLGKFHRGPRHLMGAPTGRTLSPTSGGASAEVLKYENGSEGAAALSEIVRDAADAAIKARGAFTIVLAGGSLINGLVPLAQLDTVDFSKWHVFFVDERNVPHSSPDSNYKGAFEAFLSKVPIPKDQVFAITENLGVGEAAGDYEARLKAVPQATLPRNAEGFPVFDLMLLGVGPDGHVASLFPGHPEIQEKQAWVLPVSNSPKPPPERITLTLPLINSAREIGIVAFGDGKAEIVKEVLTNPAAGLPAQQVSPQGRLFWLLDEGSARTLDAATWQ